MKDVKHSDHHFMISVRTLATPHDSGNRLVKGSEALGVALVQLLGGPLSEVSKDKVRGIAESNPEHIAEAFRGRSCISAYNATETRRVDIYWIPASME